MIINNLATAGLPSKGAARLLIESLVETVATTQEGETYTRLEGRFKVLEYGDPSIPATGTEVIRSRFSLRPRALFRFRNLYKGVTGSVPTDQVDTQQLASSIEGREVWGVITHTDPNEAGDVYADLGAKFGAKLEDVARYAT